MKPFSIIAIIAIVIILAVIAFIVARIYIPPAFSVDLIDNLTKSGKFTFGGVQNNFSLTGGVIVQGRSGWSLQAKPIIPTNGIPSPIVSFDLYKNGKFVKNLRTVTFEK